MAPEQIKEDSLDPATDQYALGIMLYELSMLKTPFESDKSRILPGVPVDELEATASFVSIRTAFA